MYGRGRRRITDVVDEPEDRGREAWRYFRIIGTSVAAAILLGVSATTCFLVGPNDRAVVQRLGAYSRTESPGFHNKQPWPFESRHTIPTEKIRRLELGYRTEGGIDPKTGKPKYKNVPEEVTMMTKDENVALVEFSLQYVIKDPFAYYFNVKDPDKTLHDISQAIMRRIVAQSEIDYVLLAGKPEIQIRARDGIQNVADSYGMGVKILVVQLADVRAPSEVKPAFDDVQKASEDRETLINEGRTYANRVVPEARGRAYQIEQEAVGYRATVTNRAKGDADRFLETFERYRIEPNIARRQLYLQEMYNILGHIQKTIVDKDVPMNIFREQK